MDGLRHPENHVMLKIPVLIIVFTLLGPLLSLPARAQPQDRVRIEYEPPKNPAHQRIYEEVKNARVLELVKDALSSFRLPRVLSIKLAGCDGFSNAWYDGEGITVCYEYVEDVMKN